MSAGLGPDFSLVAFGDLLDNREAKASAILYFRIGSPFPKEEAENLLRIFTTQSIPIILYRYDMILFFFHIMDAYLAEVISTIFQGIIHEIPNRPYDG